jgi:hypothetical protein
MRPPTRKPAPAGTLYFASNETQVRSVRPRLQQVISGDPGETAALKTAALRPNLEEKPCPRRAGDRAPATDPRLRDCAVRPQKNRTLGNEGCGTRRPKLGRALTLCFASNGTQVRSVRHPKKIPTRNFFFARMLALERRVGHPQGNCRSSGVRSPVDSTGVPKSDLGHPPWRTASG